MTIAKVGKSKERTRNYYVYTLARPSTDRLNPNAVFYVGKGTKSRLFDHEEEAANGIQSRKCDVIREIWASGGQVQKAIHYQTTIEQDALIYEWVLINMIYASSLLTNVMSTDPLLMQRKLPRRSRTKREVRLVRLGIFRQQAGISLEGIASEIGNISWLKIKNVENGKVIPYKTAIQILQAINRILIRKGKPEVTFDNLELMLI